METMISVVATVLSQIFLAMFAGFCWNTGMVELGFNSISVPGAIAIWFGFLAVFINFAFVYVNLFKNTMVPLDDNKPAIRTKPPDDDSPAV